MDLGSSSTPARPAVANVVKNSHTDGLGQKEIMFTIKTLTKYLMTIEDQELPVKVCIDDTKLNLRKISLNNTGYGKWEQGEIRLIGKE
jgi:hypothetical protein